MKLEELYNIGNYTLKNAYKISQNDIFFECTKQNNTEENFIFNIPTRAVKFLNGIILTSQENNKSHDRYGYSEIGSTNAYNTIKYYYLDNKFYMQPMKSNQCKYYYATVYELDELLIYRSPVIDLNTSVPVFKIKIGLNFIECKIAFNGDYMFYVDPNKNTMIYDKNFDLIVKYSSEYLINSMYNDHIVWICKKNCAGTDLNYYHANGGYKYDLYSIYDLTNKKSLELPVIINGQTKYHIINDCLICYTNNPNSSTINISKIIFDNAQIDKNKSNKIESITNEKNKIESIVIEKKEKILRADVINDLLLLVNKLSNNKMT